MTRGWGRDPEALDPLTRAEDAELAARRRNGPQASG